MASETNVRLGGTKTVHNLKAETPGDGGWISVPSCSVATAGRSRAETTDAVTCKACLKHP